MNFNLLFFWPRPIVRLVAGPPSRQMQGLKHLHLGAIFGALLFGLCSVATHAQTNLQDAKVQSCATCSPMSYINQARLKLNSALFQQLDKGNVPTEASSSALMRSAIYQEQGNLKAAFIEAKRASAACLLEGDATLCAESISSVAELILAQDLGNSEYESRALALISMVDASLLPRTQCAHLTLLRYRLADRHLPRLAKGHWADACGGLGTVGELGYRASKAALLYGNFEESSARLSKLGTSDNTRQIRIDYLRAVLDVANGANNAAIQKFEKITQLLPDTHLKHDENQARILSFLQLGRLLRANGQYELALHAYQGIASGTSFRKQALLESAISAAHLGRLKQAKAYLDAVAALEHGLRARVDVERLRASLAVLELDAQGAAAAFAKLVRLGKHYRQILADESAPALRLQKDPTLEGLLQAEQGERLNTMERQLAIAQRVLTEAKLQEQILRTEVVKHGAPGPIRRALETLKEADALLRRAENLITLRFEKGVTLAGPAQSAMHTQREAHRLRTQLDKHLKRLMRIQLAKNSRFKVLLDLEKEQIAQKEKLLSLLTSKAETEIYTARILLWKQAENTAIDLEMAQEIGILEFALRKKRQQSLEIQRIHKEHTEAMATLTSDTLEVEEARP